MWQRRSLLLSFSHGDLLVQLKPTALLPIQQHPSSTMQTIQKKKHSTSNYSIMHHAVMQLRIYSTTSSKQLTANIRSTKYQCAHSIGARICFAHFSRELNQGSSAVILAILDL